MHMNFGDLTLETLWYIVIGCSMLMYTVLDGFDLGVGALHLWARNDEERRIFLNSIGPVWDGNEVWIVVVIGGLFAGFPNAYATVFSGFYSLLMFIIAGFMFRAAAIEFRSKLESPRWRSVWDVVFCLASILVAFVLGLILGNAIEGIPLNSEQEYIGGFVEFFRPYSVTIAVTSVALFAMHGAIYLALKTEGDAHARVMHFIKPAIAIFLFCYIVATISTFLFMPHMTERLAHNMWLIGFAALSLAAIFNIPLQVQRKRFGWAFGSSSVAIASLLVLFGIGRYPMIVESTVNPEHNSLTIYNSAASHPTLVILLIVVAIGIPLVLAYLFWTYRVFRGKVKLEKSSY